MTARRNDPCPCGSGKKYKKCCGLTESAAAPAIDPNALLQQAMRLHQSGQLAPAEALYRQILAVRPSDPNALQLLGLIYHQHGQHALAAELMDKSVAQNPGVAEWQINLGSVHAALNNLDVAQRHYRAAVRINPKLAAAQASLGGLLLGCNQAEEAERHLRLALMIDPTQAEAELNLGIALSQQGKFAEAAQRYQRALQLKPDYPEAWYNLGNAHQESGESEPALDAYRRALELRPDYAKAHINLGIALRQAGRLAEAITHCRRAATIASDLPEGHFNLIKTAEERYLQECEQGEPLPPPSGGKTSSAQNNQLVSVIICSVRDEKFAATARMYGELLAGTPFEIIRIGDAQSLCEGYNRGIAQSRGDLLVFSHDDIEILSPDFNHKLRRHLADYDLIGVAGTTRVVGRTWGEAGWPHLHGWVAHPDLEQAGYEICVFRVLSTVVENIQGVDGLFFAARRGVAEQIGFDAATFDGFHFYDLDFSYRAHLAGYKLAVCNDIVIAHHSRGNFDARWETYAQRFAAKHRAILPPPAPGQGFSPAVKLKTGEQVGAFCRFFLATLDSEPQ